MNTSRRLTASALTFGLGLTLWGCGTGTVSEPPVPGNIFPPIPAKANVHPLFDPTSGNPATIPLPNDLLRDTGATNPANKGLINKFPDKPEFQKEPFTSLASMRGFSTSGNIIIPFDGAIDAASVNDSSVLLVEGPSSTAPDASTGAGTNATIKCNISVTNSAGNSSIILQPQLPLKPLTNYYVVVTNGVQSNGLQVASGNITDITKSEQQLSSPAGNEVYPVPDASAASLETLRSFYQDLWTRAEAITGQDRANIPMVFRFGTQPLFATLRTIRATVAAQPARPLVSKTLMASETYVPGSVTVFYNTIGLGAAPHGNINYIANITFQADNYISPETTAAAAGSLPQGAPIGNFSGSGLPGDPPLAVQNIKTKSAWVIAPNGYNSNTPVVIFQHGITGSRNHVFPIANAFCQSGYAVIATDLVGHGDDTPVTTPAVTSGQLFINLSYLRNGRDNIRQSVVNQYYLAKLVRDGSLDIDPNPGSDFSTTANPAYTGMSLGAIVGTIFTATEWNSRLAVLNVAGGRIGSLLLNSAQISPQVINGLAAQGVTQGSAAFTQFFLIAQTVVDDADPFNYAAPALAGALKQPAGSGSASTVLQQEVINDQVVPNVASRDLAHAFAQVPTFKHVGPVVQDIAIATTATTDNPTTAYAGSGFFQYPTGAHGILLDPSQGNTAACQYQVGAFLFTALTPLTARIINPFILYPKQLQDWTYKVIFGPFQP